MLSNRIKKKIRFELGEEIEKDFLRLVTSAEQKKKGLRNRKSLLFYLQT